ncbi:hypothetical protein MauCBS54593_006065 [Microsporum audouinii]
MAFLLLAAFTPMLQVIWPANRGAPETINAPAHTPEDTHKSVETPQEAKNEGEKVDSDHQSHRGNRRNSIIDCIPGLSKFKCPVTIWSRSGSSPYDAAPLFYIYREDGTKVPLIPLDELPPGLKVGRQNWYHRFWLRYMTPASLGKYPKKGEYEVIIQTGTRLKPRIVRTPSGRMSPSQQDLSSPILECCSCAGGNSCTREGTCMYSQRPSNAGRVSLKTPLSAPPSRGRGNRSRKPITPPNSLTADVSRAQSINKKGNAAEIDGFRLQRGLDRLARQQSLTSRSSVSDSPMVLLDLDSVKGTCSDGSVTPASVANDIAQQDMDSLRLLNSAPSQLGRDEEPNISHSQTMP